ncbi:MAG: cation diffusion facilitator family transporter [Candidatus Brocadiaceae bacterium]|jgi:cobalt-zinc-cadmium efflux system protein
MSQDHRHNGEGLPKSPDVGHLHAEVPTPGGGKIRRLRWAIVVTGSIMLVEVVGGVVSNSLALLSDAGHMFTHLFALGMSYFAIRISARPATAEKSFGYFRAEVLAAFVNGLFLFGITGYIFYEAVSRILEPEPIEMIQMLVVAAFGLAANGISVMLLAKVSHGDLNLRSAFIHVVYDTISSIAVVAAAVLMKFTGVTLFDPIVSILIGVLILFWAWRVVRDSARILMESTPADVDLDRIRNDLPRIAGVRSVHDVHVWQITTDMYVMTAHVVVDNVPMVRAEDIMGEVNGYLRRRHKIGHATLQLECSPTPREERRTSPREWPDWGRE